MEYFHVKTDVLLENNLAQGVRHLIEKESSKNIVVFVDHHLCGHPSVLAMEADLKKDRACELRSIPSGEPTTDQVNELTGLYRGKSTDMFVAIGGGSVIDLTKSVAALVVNEGKIEDYQGTGKIFPTGVKKICVPTTAGTGCEISGAAVLINQSSAFKRGVVGPGVVPSYALLCSELTATLPADMTYGCGMDAIVHAVESYVSSKATAFSRIFSKEAFLRLYTSLQNTLEDLTNLEYRSQMLMGSCLAGYAIDNASTGAAHGMSYGPGIHFHIPHGFAVGIFFVETMLVNIQKGCYAYSDLYRALPGAAPSGDDKQDSELFVNEILNYAPYKQYNKTLYDFGVKKDNLELLAKASMQNTVAYSTNPVPFAQEDSYHIYHKLLKD